MDFRLALAISKPDFKLNAVIPENFDDQGQKSCQKDVASLHDAIGAIPGPVATHSPCVFMPLDQKGQRSPSHLYRLHVSRLQLGVVVDYDKNSHSHHPPSLYYRQK